MNGGGMQIIFLRTIAKFRDFNAWYHICYLFDTTQSTAADRVKIYVNGEQQTSFDNSNLSCTKY